MKKAVATVLPAAAGVAAVSAALLGTGESTGYFGLLLWPALVALVFLLGCVSVVLLGALRWLWPLGTGFIVQTVGLILLASERFTDRLEPLWWTLGSVGIVLFVMLVVWLTVTVRARWLEQQMIRGVKSDMAGDELDKIRANMTDALSKLRQAGGRSAIYELPWFLVIGRSQVGKTVAIKNSGLISSRKDWVKGVGGTVTLNFFFTNDLIFLDTPGKWVQDGAMGEEQQQWLETLRLLRKYRGRRPLDGIVATVSADDLLSLSDEKLRDQASRVREVIDLLYDETHFRFPIYLLVTKCDLVEGFVEFFRNLPAQRRHEILGWSNEDPEQMTAEAAVPRAFFGIVRRLEAFRLEMLARITSSTRARKLYFFAEEFKRLEGPLAVYSGELFGGDRYHEAPVFRGFYFTSGTQGEGMPLSQALSELVKGLGVKSAAAQVAEGEEEPKRSYFLLKLFRDLMVSDDGLVGRTAVHWWHQRRNTFFGAFLPATIALSVLVFSAISFAVNRHEFRTASDSVVRTMGQLRDIPAKPSGEQIAAALERTQDLQEQHHKITRWGLLRTWGMRRPGALDAQVLQAFQTEFQSKALDPTLEDAVAVSEDDLPNCIEKIEVARAVVFLRLAPRFNTTDDALAGFKRVWALDQADAAQAKIRKQFRYLWESKGADRQQLLAGFRLREVAEGVVKSCGSDAAPSSLDLLRDFEAACVGRGLGDDRVNCYTKLMTILNWTEERYQRTLKSMGDLKQDLQELVKEKDEGAAEALSVLSRVPFTKPKSNPCLQKFQKDVVPAIKKYAVREALIRECEAGAGGNRYAAWNGAYKTHEGDLRAALDEIKKKSAELKEGPCAGAEDFDGVNVSRIEAVCIDYWHYKCTGNAPGLPPPPPSTIPGQVRRSGPPKGDGVRRSDLQWLSQGSPVASLHRYPSWKAKKEAWASRINQSGLGGSARETELHAVNNDIQDYGKRYAEAWRGYLRGLQVVARPPDDQMPIEKWFEKLADTDEWGNVLRDAAKNLAIDEHDEPFVEMSNELGSLRQMQGFVEQKLPEYIQRLATIAAELKTLSGNDKGLQGYKQKYKGAPKDTSLGEAKFWVQANSGPESLLKSFLMAPLQEAEQYVSGGNSVPLDWTRLVRQYNDVADKLLFGGKVGDEVASEQSLVALLGGATGTVKGLQEAPEGEFSEDARRWLDRASKLSKLFFKPGKDEVSPIEISVSIGGTTLVPTKIAEGVSYVSLGFSDSNAVSWDEDEMDTTKGGKVFLVGDAASRISSIRVKVKREVGFLKKKPESVALDSIQERGDAAFLKLFAKGAGGDLAQFESGQPIRFSFPVKDEDKKKEKGKATLELHVEGPALASLIDFVKHPLSAPPETPK